MESDPIILPMRFAYYDNLTAESQRIYRKSDSIFRVEIPDIAALIPLAKAIDPALTAAQRDTVERACQALVDARVPRRQHVAGLPRRLHEERALEVGEVVDRAQARRVAVGEGTRLVADEVVPNVDAEGIARSFRRHVEELRDIRHEAEGP